MHVLKKIIPALSLLVFLCGSVGFHPLGLLAQPSSGEVPLAQRHPLEDLQAAQAAAKQQSFDKALTILQPYTANPLEFPLQVSDYITILYWQGKPDKALSFYESLPPSFPQRDYLLSNMARASYDLGRQHQAAVLYQKLLERHPDDADALEGLVRSLLAEEQNQKAYDSLKKHPELTNKNKQLQGYEITSLMHLRRYAEALSLYDQVAAQYPSETSTWLEKRDEQFKALSPTDRAEAMQQVQQNINHEKKEVSEHLFVLTMLFQDTDTALTLLKEQGFHPQDFSAPVACQIARAYFTKGQDSTALQIYTSVLSQYPSDFEARLGSVYVLARMGNHEKAMALFDGIQKEYEGNLKIYYAQAYLYEQQRDFIRAIEVYDHMLKLAPDNMVVERLRIRAYSDLGASLYALELATQFFPQDQALKESILGDYALNPIQWEAPKEAVAIYNSIVPAAETDRQRYLFDRIIALGKAEEHKEVVQAYEELVEGKKYPIPPWVKESAAGSYLYLEDPDRALQLYNEALKQDSKSLIAHQGKFSTLQELRKWCEAEALYEELDKRTPEYIWAGKRRAYNEEKMSLNIDRGWMLMYGNRLNDAEPYFGNLYEKAPGNISVRSARAHLHAWRGWPRRSLEEFNIISSMAPNYRAAKTGKISVLNTLAHKEEARDVAAELLAQRPDDKHLNQLVRDLKIEEMNGNNFNFYFETEEDGGKDLGMQDEAFTPLSLYTNLFATWQYRRTWKDKLDETGIALGDDKPVYFRRGGIGMDHTFNSDWGMRQLLTVDYESGDEFGSLTQVNWNPDDEWFFTGSFDSFSIDIAQRARRAGVTAKQANFSATYKESEWRQYDLGISRQFFSDGNDRDQLSLGYEQNLFIKNDWRMRVYLNLYAMKNSDWDSDTISYYNPESTWGASLTHMTEQTVWDAYEKYFAHRLYLTVGNSKQQNYTDGVITSVKYEQDFTFSHTNSLLWSVWYGDHLYDGDRTASLVFNIMWKIRF